MTGTGNNTSQLEKVILKAVYKGNKKDSKSFTLRKIKTGSVRTCDNLKEVIRKQLCQEIIPNDFDVGYADGANIVQIRTIEDMNELWDNLRKPSNKKTVWCDGLKEPEGNTNKRQRLSTDFDDEDIFPPHAKKKRRPTQKEEQVQNVDSLKKKHDTNFTPMQYRIWGEMVAGGLHINTDNPPNTTMGYTFPEKNSTVDSC